MNYTLILITRNKVKPEGQKTKLKKNKYMYNTEHKIPGCKKFNWKGSTHFNLGTIVQVIWLWKEINSSSFRFKHIIKYKTRDFLLLFCDK